MIECATHLGRVGLWDQTPCFRGIETADHLARLAVRVLVGAVLVACRTALALAKIGDGVGGGALELIREVRIVLLELLDEGTDLANDFECDLICARVFISCSPR